MPSELNMLAELTQLSLSTIDFKKSISQQSQEEQESLVLNYRAEIRSKLLFAQNELSGHYSKKITDFILFLVISSIDEKCKTILNEENSTAKWSDLQVEFFQRSDGGEYVFGILDEIIANKIYPKICYELSLVILQEGFLGKYYQNPHHSERHQYMKCIKDILNDLHNSAPESLSLIQETRLPQDSNNQRFQFITIIVVVLAIAIPVATYLF